MADFGRNSRSSSNGWPWESSSTSNLHIFFVREVNHC